MAHSLAHSQPRLQADGNNCIRRIDLSSGLVTTLAGGSPGGFKDGVGTDALFDNPMKVSFDPTGATVFVVSGSGGVGVAGWRVRRGWGHGSPAWTYALKPAPPPPQVDNNNQAIRRVDLASGAVTTIAGTHYGYTEGVGTEAVFGRPNDIACDLTGASCFVVSRRCVSAVVPPPTNSPATLRRTWTTAPSAASPSRPPS